MNLIKKPSVSKILEMIFWESWADIPEFALKAAINKGNCLHERAEHYINFGEKLDCICDKKVKTHIPLFENLCNDLDNLEFGVELLSERRFETHDLVGIIDLQIKQGDKIILVDFKTNSSVHLTKWAYQLNMYAYLHNQSWDIDWNKYELEVWHYNAKHKQQIHKLEPLTQTEITEIQEAIEVYWKEKEIENGKEII